MNMLNGAPQIFNAAGAPLDGQGRIDPMYFNAAGNPLDSQGHSPNQINIAAPSGGGGGGGNGMNIALPGDVLAGYRLGMQTAPSGGGAGMAEQQALQGLRAQQQNPLLAALGG